MKMEKLLKYTCLACGMKILNLAKGVKKLQKEQLCLPVNLFEYSHIF